MQVRACKSSDQALSSDFAIALLFFFNPTCAQHQQVYQSCQRKHRLSSFRHRSHQFNPNH